MDLLNAADTIARTVDCIWMDAIGGRVFLWWQEDTR